MTMSSLPQPAPASASSSALGDNGDRVGLPDVGKLPSATIFIDEEVDKDLIEKVEAAITSSVFIFKKTGWRRRAFLLSTPFLYGSGLVSQSNTSTIQLAGTSTAAALVLNHLEKILQQTEVPKSEYGYAKYLEIIENIPIHRFLKDECTAFLGPWDLVACAAIASKKIYSNREIGVGGVVTVAGPDVRPSGNIKAFSVYSDIVDNKHVLILTIRGSVNKQDWFVNLNGAPRLSKQILDGTFSFHSGFLVTALAMESKAADLIASEVSIIRHAFDSILFTGHSAGGGIAQIFYAMANTPGSALNTATSKIQKKHCVTFAAPPVSSIRIPHQGDGEFINVINEGDPVGLAQQAYIESLLDVFTLSESDLMKRYPGPFAVPLPVMKASAEKIVILRDPNPEDVRNEALEACLVNPEILETKLFGNILLHPINVYLEHLKKVAGDYFLQDAELESRRTSMTLYDTDQELLMDENKNIPVFTTTTTTTTSTTTTPTTTDKAKDI